MNEVFVFVYSKEKQIKVLGLDNSTKLHDSLISEGCKHTHTLDACVYLENLHNKCDAIDTVSEVRSLGF